MALRATHERVCVGVQSVYTMAQQKMQVDLWKKVVRMECKITTTL